MTPAEVSAKLRVFNDWRRGELDDLSMPDPREIGLAIDAAIEMIEHLEATEEDRSNFLVEIGKLCAQCDALRAKIETAENDAAHQKALAASALRVAEGWERKCGELRAKVAEMGQQEPVGVLHVGSYYGEELQDWEFEANQCACDKLNEAYVRNPMSLPLYALPGAQPAPSVPDAWKLVPIEPTEAMVTAFAELFNVRDQKNTFGPAFRAALAAAPEAKP